MGPTTGKNRPGAAGQRIFLADRFGPIAVVGDSQKADITSELTFSEGDERCDKLVEQKSLSLSASSLCLLLGINGVDNLGEEIAIGHSLTRNLVFQ